jgi:Ca-activated chloride channel family protein
MRKSFFLSWLLIICFGGFSQTGSICGKIIEKSTGDPIIGAAVLLFDSLSVNKYPGATTDLDGNYCINNLKPGKYNLKISYVGFGKVEVQKVIVTGYKKTVCDLQMNEPIQLQELEIVNRGARSNCSVHIDACTISKMPSVNIAGKARRRGRSKVPKQRPVKVQKFNTEEYAKIDDNGFREVKKNPLSTFSVDVDKASYSNVRRLLNEGTLPPADAVRVEEMINYFHYTYPQPAANEPFSITTEYTDCPWNKAHNLVHIGMRAMDLKEDSIPANNLVFLIDVSGSMQDWNKLPLLKEGLSLLIKQLREKDRVSMVVYAGAAGVVLNSTPGWQKEQIEGALQELQAGGSTAGGQGIELAYKIAQENFIKGANNRIVLATDGDFNVGVSSDGELVRLIEEKRESGVYLTVLGFGMGNYKDSKMEQLADKGNGNYAYIDNIAEAEKVLVKEMKATLHTVAKDVKLQIEFNPSKVKAYRLVGYENRLLKDEDFNDDTKDAGDMGAGHTVTAIYEIVPAGSSESVSSVDPLKYQTMQASAEAGNNEIMTIKCRYKKPGRIKSARLSQVIGNSKKDFDDVSDNCKFSCAVAEFGMLLRNSDFKGSVTYKDVLKQAKASKGTDEEGYRSEFIGLVEKAEAINKGKTNEKN